MGAGHAGIDQEAFRAYPVSCQVEVVQARHSGARSAGEAAFSGGWERTDGLDTRQVLAPDQRTAPARLRRVEQVFEIALVLTRVPGYRGSSCLKEMIRAAPSGATRE